MRRGLVVGNWKMNGTRALVRQFLGDILDRLEADLPAEVGICVPFVLIPEAAMILQGSSVLLGAQNVADHDEGGPYTGEVAASMLREFDCRLAIVGHTERRVLYGESDAMVAARYLKALQHGIQPILCVGETASQRAGGNTFAAIDEQLDAVIAVAGVSSLEEAVIAYEPVWAVGTGRTATAEQAQEVHAYIRHRVAAMDGQVAKSLRILYGGSVTPDNAAALFSMPDIDGGLVGRAALDAKAFLSICYSLGDICTKH